MEEPLLPGNVPSAPGRSRDSTQESVASVNRKKVKAKKKGPRALFLRRKRWILLWVVWASIWLDYALVGILVPLFPYMFTPSSNVFKGIWFGTRPLLQILFGPSFEWSLRSMIGNTGTLLIGLVTLIVSTSFLCFAERESGMKDHNLLILGRIVHTAASSLIMSGGSELASSLYTSQRHKHRAVGSVMTAVSFGSMLGPIIGALLFQYGEELMPLWFIGVGGTLTLAILCFSLLYVSCCGPTFQGEPESSMQQVTTPLVVRPESSRSSSSFFSDRSDLENVLVPTVYTVASSTVENEEASASFQSTNEAEFDVQMHWSAYLCDLYLLSACLMIVFSHAVFSLMEPLVPLFAKTHFNLSPVENAGVWSAVPVTFLLTAPLASRALQNGTSRVRLFMVGLVLYAAGLPFLTNTLWEAESVGATLSCMVVCSAATAITLTVSSNYVSDILAWRYFTNSVSVVSVCVKQSSNIGAFLGPVIGFGILEFVDYALLDIVFAGVCFLLGLLCTVLFLRHVPRPEHYVN